MGEHLSKDLTDLSWDDLDDLADFTGLNRELARIQARLDRVRPLIAQLEAGLSKSSRIVTQLEYMTGHSSYLPTIVYRRNEDGTWLEHGRVVAVGGHQEFFGDSAFVTKEGILVFTDSQAGVGVSVVKGSRIRIVEPANGNSTRLAYRAMLARHQETLSLLDKVPAGEEKHFDRMYH